MSCPGSDPEVISLDPPRPGGDEKRPPTRRSALAIAGLTAGLAILFIVLSRTPNATVEEPSTTQPTSSDPTSSTAPVADTEPADTLAADATTFSDRRVELLPGHRDLDGQIALATFATGGDSETVWIIGPDQALLRRDVPLWPGDWPYYILFSESRLAFTSPPNALLLDAELDREPQPLVAARYLIPGTEHSMMWAIDEPISTITQLALPSGEIGRQIELDPAITWVTGAVADGFVVMVDGNQRFWSPDSGFQDLPAPASDQSGFYQGRGNKAVMISPGPMASVVDLVDSSRIDVVFDVGEGLVTEVCLSPTMEYLAVESSTGQGVVIDLHQRTTVVEFTTGQQFDALGWTSIDQLVYFDDSQNLIAVSIPKGEPIVVARLRDTSIELSLAGSAAIC